MLVVNGGNPRSGGPYLTRSVCHGPTPWNGTEHVYVVAPIANRKHIRDAHAKTIADNPNALGFTRTPIHNLTEYWGGSHRREIGKGNPHLPFGSFDILWLPH